MSKKVNPAAVGLFVTGALVILLAGLVVLGSGKFFEQHERFVVYFQGSVNGLEEGSAVQLGGVKVGSVVQMHVQFDPETNQKVVPVVIELSASRILQLSVDGVYTKDKVLSREAVAKAVEERGLRARLISKSALTGQLFIDLDFFPDDQEGYTFPGNPIDGLTQIPTTKNEIERVLESIAKSVEKLSVIDFGQLITDVNGLVVEIDEKVGELDIGGISDRAKKTLDHADATMANIDKLVTDEHLTQTFANLDSATADIKGAVAAFDGEQVSVAVAEAEEAMSQIKLAAANIAKVTTTDSTTTVRLNRALARIEEASKAIEQLADYLKRNPNALISGKKAR